MVVSTRWDNALWDDQNFGWDADSTTYLVIPNVKRFEQSTSPNFARTEQARFEQATTRSFQRNDQ